jgi:two-component system chemotaxis response regulator CheB
MSAAGQKTIKVLIVEDSPTVAKFLTQVLHADPRIRVVGTAFDGQDALEAVQRTRPDVIAMDIHMPKLNGFEATRTIMEMCPTAIVIFSGSNADELRTNFHAIEAGALAVVRRPNGVGHPDHEATAKEFVETVKSMSEVKVVRRWPRISRAKAVSHTEAIPAIPPKGSSIKAVAIRPVLFRASSSGSQVLPGLLCACQPTVNTSIPAKPTSLRMIFKWGLGPVIAFIWSRMAAKTECVLPYHSFSVLSKRLLAPPSWAFS